MEIQRKSETTEELFMGNLRIGYDLEETPDVKITYYAYYMNSDFDTKESDRLVSFSNNEINIEVVESRIRPLSDFPEIADIIINVAGYEVLKGFLSSFGNNIYEKIKNRLTTLFRGAVDSRGIEMERGVHFCFSTLINGSPCQVKLAVLLNDINKDYDLDSVILFLDSLIFENRMNEILIKKIDKAPYWQFVYGIGENNKLVRN